MSTISIKFPISIDIIKAKEAEVPSTISNYDGHHFGRVMCRYKKNNWREVKIFDS